MLFSSAVKILILGFCGKPGYRFFYAMFEQICSIWDRVRNFFVERETKRDPELYINMTALVETTGLQRDLLEAMDIEELENLWKRIYLYQEASSLSSDKMMDRVLDDEEKYAGIIATYADHIGFHNYQ